MPEVGIGLVPDVGGSALLAAAPGHLGEYLGTTATRMNAGDAIFVGFADYFIPQDQWEDAKSVLQENGIDALSTFYAEAPDSDLKGTLADINAVFSGARMRDIFAAAGKQHGPLCRTGGQGNWAQFPAGHGRSSGYDPQPARIQGHGSRSLGARISCLLYTSPSPRD